jgi:hypothetical protein
MGSSGDNAGLFTVIHILMVLAVVGLIVAYIVIKPIETCFGRKAAV